MLCSLRKITFVFAVIVAFVACSDDSAKLEEPIDADQVDDDPASSDENAGSLDESFDDSAPMEPDSQQEESMSEDVEGALSEPDGALPAAPSEKGGIISSGVKDKKRCRLIADELERQKCLRQQAK